MPPAHRAQAAKPSSGASRLPGPHSILSEAPGQRWPRSHGKQAPVPVEWLPVCAQATKECDAEQTLIGDGMFIAAQLLAFRSLECCREAGLARAWVATNELAGGALKARKARRALACTNARKVVCWAR